MQGTIIQHTPSGIIDKFQTACYTLHLFNYSDYKTIFFPILFFVLNLYPNAPLQRIIQSIVWIWLNLLQCSVATQYKNMQEDRVNKPWRPLPSGRITSHQAIKLYWTLAFACPLVSAMCGSGPFLSSFILVVGIAIYDAYWSHHWLGKNISGVVGYGLFGWGAACIMGGRSFLPSVISRTVAEDSLLIFFTIQTQDFADVVGDMAKGRVTIPIRFPNTARRLTVFALLFWSIVFNVTKSSSTSIILGLLVLGLGSFVAFHLWSRRDAASDRFSYVLYNLWLLLVLSLSAQHARLTLRASHVGAQAV